MDDGHEILTPGGSGPDSAAGAAAAGGIAAGAALMRPFSVPFSLQDGLSATQPVTRRRLSQMRGMFADRQAQQAAIAAGDPLVYEFYELDIPETAGHLRFGTSIIQPGRVGREFFMTKGHFHQIVETAEVYYCLQGSGFMLMETPEGDTAAEPLRAGAALYVPPRWAHRSVNTGATPLVVFFVFRSDAGHDYGTIEQKGFRKLVVAGGEGPEIVDNPGWAGY